MRILRLGWSVTWRMSIWGLVLGISFGALYGPLSIVLYVLLEPLGRMLAGTVDASQTNVGFSMVFATLGGMIIGGIVGLMGGVAAGVVQSAGLCCYLRRSIDPILRRGVFVRVSTMVVGSLTLLLPLAIAFAAGSVDVLLFVLWVAIPGIAAATVAGWLSEQIVEWASESAWPQVSGA